MQREIRNVPAQVKTEEKKIVGYAAVFNKLSEDFGGWRERILPSAFDNTLKKNKRVKALVNHDEAELLGHTENNRLKLNVDAEGLKIEIDPTDTSYARDAMVNLREGNIDKMSFAMIVNNENWIEEDGQEIRELVDVELFEVSILTADPAYPDTSVGLRMLEEYRAAKAYQQELEQAKEQAEQPQDQEQDQEQPPETEPKGFDAYDLLQKQMELESYPFN